MDDPGSTIAVITANVLSSAKEIPAGSIILYILLIVGSAYFSGTEISLASVNRIHLMSRASKGSKAAERALYILDNFDEALSVLLIGNNIVNIGCATLSTFVATHLWGLSSVPAATAFTTVIIFVFGEMLPKSFAKSCNERFAEMASGTLLLLMRLLKPLSFIFTSISAAVSKPFTKNIEAEVTMTEDELYDIVENISEEDDFDEDKGRLVKSALDFSNATVEQILVPWGNVEKIYMNMKTAQILELIKESVHSRLPVIDRRGNVKGILQIRNFIKAYISRGHNVILSSVIDYPYFARRDISIDDLLTDMSNHRRNLAVIKDDDGGIMGIVTIEDILEELVGEIYDEDDIGREDAGGEPL